MQLPNFDDMIGHAPYLDANVYIYAFEGFADKRATLLPLLDFLGQKDIEVTGSELLLPELLTKPMALDDQELIDRYLDFFDAPGSTTLVPVTRAILTLAAELRADEGLALADAIHIATAIDQGCTSFVTADETLASIDDLPIVSLQDLSFCSAP